MKLSDSVLRARAAAKVAKAADDAEWMEAVLRMGDGATFERWCAQMHAIKGWARQTFKRRLEGFKKQHPELTGGRWWGDPYLLPTPPTEAMAERVLLLRSWLDPRNLRNLEQIVQNRTVNLTGTGTRASTGPLRSEPSGGDLITQATAHTRLKGNVR